MTKKKYSDKTVHVNPLQNFRVKKRAHNFGLTPYMINIHLFTAECDEALIIQYELCVFVRSKDRVTR